MPRSTFPYKILLEGYLSEGIVSAVDLPEFNRAAMDGYAVRSSDTRSASTTNPVYLNLGENVTQVRTGMAVPDNFDAVVMLEETFLRGNRVEVMGEVHPFRNVSRIGEDIAIGDLIFKEGHRIRPPDIALLAALGIKEVSVYARPKDCHYTYGRRAGGHRRAAALTR